MITRSAGVIEAEIEGEIVAMNIETGNCYGLNGVGSRIWSLAAIPVLLEEICNQLTKEFEIEQDACERQVLDFIKELHAEKLIVVIESK